MSDLIRREDVFKTLGITDKSTKYGGDHSGYNTLMLYEIMDAIDSIPTAEPKVGKWIEKEDGLEGQYWDCSVCGISWAFNDSGTPSEHGVNYCPNCGAKMERSE